MTFKLRQPGKLDFRCRNCNFLMTHIQKDFRGFDRVCWLCSYCELGNKLYEELYLKIVWAKTNEDLNRVGEMIVKAEIPKVLKELEEIYKAGITKRVELNLEKNIQ